MATFDGQIEMRSRPSTALLHMAEFELMKKVKAEPELLTDFDKHLNIKKGMRGSISVVSKRFPKTISPSVICT